MDTKPCVICERRLPFASFYKRRNECKDCYPYYKSGCKDESLRPKFENTENSTLTSTIIEKNNATYIGQIIINEYSQFKKYIQDLIKENHGLRLIIHKLKKEQSEESNFSIMSDLKTELENVTALKEKYPEDRDILKFVDLYRELSDKNTELSEENLRVVKRKDNYEREVDKLSTEVENLKKDMNEKISHLEDELSQEIEEHDITKKKYEKTFDDRQDMKFHIDDLNKIIDKYKMEKMELLDKITSLTNKITEQEDLLKDMEGDLNDARDEVLKEKERVRRLDVTFKKSLLMLDTYSKSDKSRYEKKSSELTKLKEELKKGEKGKDKDKDRINNEAIQLRMTPLMEDLNEINKRLTYPSEVQDWVDDMRKPVNIVNGKVEVLNLERPIANVAKVPRPELSYQNQLCYDAVTR
jgi:DNA repair exonuclease SbcCD ATPase subunit